MDIKKNENFRPKCPCCENEINELVGAPQPAGWLHRSGDGWRLFHGRHQFVTH
jgi:hypothetical protein